MSYVFITYLLYYVFFIYSRIICSFYQKWLKKSLTRKSINECEALIHQDYGYMWWLPHRTSNVIAAIGDGGNVIYVNYDKNIVVAVTGYFKPMVFDRIKYIEENIVKAIE